MQNTMNNLSLLSRENTWQNHVQPSWAVNEANSPGWQHCAMHIKGWNHLPTAQENWAAWRNFSVEPLQPTNRSWNKYIVNHPSLTFPYFYIGPFPSWQKQCPEPLHTTFGQLVSSQFSWAVNNEGIKNIKSPLRQSVYWGIHFPHNHRIYIMEGTHRSTRITLSTFDNFALDIVGEQIIYLTDLQPSEFEILETMLERGSTNPPKLTTT